MKSVCLILFWLFSQCLYSQNIDIVVDKGIYKSFYSYGYKSPLYVVYDLYNGGGDVSRSSMSFKEEYKTATNKDYSKSNNNTHQPLAK